MKDVNQKDLLCRHFGAQGWYVQPEVPVFHRGGIHEQKKIITDIDVLAFRPRTDLCWELVLGDCKTLKGQSPANRAIWLRGLMEHFSASSGILILRRKRPIEVDHKLFASSLRITLIDEAEFVKYDRALIYPDGSANHPLSLKAVSELRALSNRYPAFRALCEYTYGFAWNENNHLELLRKIIGETQAIAQEFDPGKPEHLALVLDAAGVFAIGLAECVGIIFNQYLQPGSLWQLDDALKVVIWGGRAQYKFVEKLRRDLMVAKGMQPSSAGALALPAWDIFLQLVRNMLECPRLAFSVPQLLQQAAIDINYDNSFLSHTTGTDLLLIKYAMLTSNYLCKAARFPSQTQRALEDKFIRRQSELIH